MTRILLIGIGGFVGSVLRYSLSGVALNPTGQKAFPLGTLGVNVLGCLVIGFLAELVEAKAFFRPDTRAFLFVGLLGGFTTFSAFANETINAARDGALTVALTYVVVSVVLCLAAVLAGRLIAKALWR